MNVHASNLDIEKFRKVWALTDKGATKGECEAAMARAEAIAAKAGMSLVDAVAAMNSAAGSAKATTRSTMSWEEYWEAERPKREAQFAAAERQYGPAEEAFAETMEEAKLRAFLEPFATYRKFDNANELYIDGYIGWGRKYPEKGQAHFRKLLDQALPFPETLPGLIAELDRWEALADRRCLYDSNYSSPAHVNARADALQHLIAMTPVRGWDDLDTRLEWARRNLNQGRWSDLETDIAGLDRLKADLAFLRELQTSPGAQTGQKTTAQRRAAVLSMLDAHPELPSREIARRAGVSPQTVSNLRKGKSA